MSAFLVTPVNLPRPARRIWLPLALSLALHALLALAAVTFPARQGSGAGASVPFGLVALDDGIILEDRPAGKGARAEPRHVEEESSEEAFSATVDLAPVVTPVSVPTPAAAQPAGGSGGGGEGDGGAGGGGGSGVLRAPAESRKVVYVIDRSLSMGLGGALPVAKRELLAGIGALPADGRFAVILYNRQAEPLTLGGVAGLVPATEANRAEAARLVDEARAQGGTDHVAALRRAVALGPDVIFFVTDAAELTAEEARSITSLNVARAAIHAVEINDERPGIEETPLKLLARLNGGTHRVVRVTR